MDIEKSLSDVGATARDRGFIKAIVNDYILMRPNEMQMHLMVMEEKREKLEDKEFGQVDKSSARRFVLSIPADLDIIIKKAVPDYLQKKESVYWFAKTFPMFRMTRKL